MIFRKTFSLNSAPRLFIRGRVDFVRILGTGVYSSPLTPRVYPGTVDVSINGDDWFPMMGGEKIEGLNGADGFWIKQHIGDNATMVDIVYGQGNFQQCRENSPDGKHFDTNVNVASGAAFKYEIWNNARNELRRLEARPHVKDVLCFNNTAADFWLKYALFVPGVGVTPGTDVPFINVKVAAGTHFVLNTTHGVLPDTTSYFGIGTWITSDAPAMSLNVVSPAAYSVILNTVLC